MDTVAGLAILIGVFGLLVILLVAVLGAVERMAVALFAAFRARLG